MEILALALKGLGFALRHWRLVAIGVLVSLLGVTTLRLDHAKADLSAARAALINPATTKQWRFEAERDAPALATCRANDAKLASIIRDKDVALAALGNQSAARLAAAQRDVTEANKGRAHAEARSKMLVDARLTGATACERMDQADKAVKESLR